MNESARPADLRDVLYRILDSIKQLPSPPELCFAVTRATQDEESSLVDVEALVENDIALSGRLIQVANSAFFGVRQPVASVRRAISLLGFRTVRALALGFFFNEEFGKLRLPGLPYPDLPRYALASSVLAERIAMRTDSATAVDAACLGLLHESGVIVMAMAFGRQYRQMAAKLADRRDTSLSQVETDMFGVDHVFATKLLLKGWQLADHFVEAAAHHHSDRLPSDTGADVKAMWRVLRLAQQAALLFFDGADPKSADAAVHVAGALFQWTGDDVASVLREAAALYEQRVGISGVPAAIVAKDTQVALGAAEMLTPNLSAAGTSPICPS